MKDKNIYREAIQGQLISIPMLAKVLRVHKEEGKTILELAIYTTEKGSDGASVLVGMSAESLNTHAYEMATDLPGMIHKEDVLQWVQDNL